MPEFRVMVEHKRLFSILTGSALLASCGPSYAPPNAPAKACAEISAADFAAAVKAGATQGDATISQSGIVSIDIGPGVVQCASFKSTVTPCRRPNDFVIRYSLADGTKTHVRVAAGEEYRFRLAARPTTCEIILRE